MLFENFCVNDEKNEIKFENTLPSVFFFFHFNEIRKIRDFFVFV